MLGILSGVVRRHPKTSAAIAFNIGVMVARAALRNKTFSRGMVDIPARLIELVPSAKDLGTYVPLGSTGARPKRRRTPRTKPAVRTRPKPAAE
ncbi:MAG: hypothetical protein Q8M26_17190 [Pseudolabrys sp.]|nr:hypothetical protein [Pseudolabrys sp.]